MLKFTCCTLLLLVATVSHAASIPDDKQEGIDSSQEESDIGHMDFQDLVKRIEFLEKQMGVAQFDQKIIGSIITELTILLGHDLPQGKPDNSLAPPSIDTNVTSPNDVLPVRDFVENIQDLIDRIKLMEDLSVIIHYNRIIYSVLSQLPDLKQPTETSDLVEEEDEDEPRPEVRLVGGLRSSQGRLEILDDGVLSEDEFMPEYCSVCDINFGFGDAQVICKMLGYSSQRPLIIVGSQFGSGHCKKIYKAMGCHGNESHIRYCPHVFEKADDCDHFSDVSIDCEPPEVQHEYEDKESGLMITDVRLGGLPTSHAAGRLEVQVNGDRWGTVCDNLFDVRDAIVACRYMNLLRGVKPNLTRNYDSTDRPGPVLLDGLKCSGHEKKLDDCKRKPLGHHRCHHYEDVGIDCQPHLASNTKIFCPHHTQEDSGYCTCFKKKELNYQDSQNYCKENYEGNVAEMRSKEDKQRLLKIMSKNEADIVWLGTKFIHEPQHIQIPELEIIVRSDPSACVALMADGEIKQEPCDREIPYICEVLGSVVKQ